MCGIKTTFMITQGCVAFSMEKNSSHLKKFTLTSLLALVTIMRYVWKENLKNGQNVLEKCQNVVMRYYNTITCFRCHSKKVKNGRVRVEAGRKSLTEEYSNDKTPEEKIKAIICT